MSKPKKPFLLPIPDNRVTAPSIHESGQNVAPPTSTKKNNLAAMRERTVGEQIEVEKKAWGFDKRVEAEHELAHLILRLIGVQAYNGHFAPEYHVLALETMMVEGECELEDFKTHFRAYENKYTSTELENRTLLYLMRDQAPKKPDGTPDYNALWSECHYSHDPLLEKAKKTVVGLRDDTKPAYTGGYIWHITLPQGGQYYYQPKPEVKVLPEIGPEFSMPSSASDAEIETMFERIKPALDYVTTMPEMQTLYRDARRAYQREDMVGRKTQELQIKQRRNDVLAAIPMSDLMDALGTEKLMVHRVGQEWKNRRVDAQMNPEPYQAQR